MNLRTFNFEEKEMYYKINSQHIFVQLRDHWMEYVKLFENSVHQRVHIFEIVPLAIPDCYKYIIEKVSDTSKVIIHYPKEMKDAKKWLEHLLSDEQWEGHNKHWKVVCDGKPVTFTWNYYINPLVYTRRSFSVGFKHERGQFQVLTYVSGHGFTIDESTYYNCDSINTPIDTKIKADNLELFKDDIIKRFKKLNPEKMLEAFNDDEDIWEYLTNSQWE